MAVNDPGVRRLARPVCALLRCKPVPVGSRPPNWSDAPGRPLTLYRCTRCGVECWR